MITDADRLGEGGAKSKFRDNIAAIRQLAQLKVEGRVATANEQRQLVKYVGWGGIPQAFDHGNEDWRQEFIELGQMLTQEEYARARRSTQDAHYTSQTIVLGLYRGLERLGFNGGRILEPAGGIGHFIGLMPSAIRTQSQVTSIEIDPTTSEIARHLYPSSTHINRGFQDVVVPSGYFDLCIGNPPFGNQSLYDPDHRDLSRLSIHNYFLAKSIDKVREGGLMAVVVSRYFMDGVDSEARAYIADRAHLLGAIRLPNTAFRKNALTDVTTDIIFLKRAASGENTDQTWVDVDQLLDRETGAPITVNRYFCERPQQMAGRMVITDRLHRGGVDLIADPGTDLATAVEERLACLPEGVYRAAEITHLPDLDAPRLSLSSTLKIGSLFVAPDGRVARRLPDILDSNNYAYVEFRNDRNAERAKGMILVRDALRELMHSEQLETNTDLEITEKRATLNRVYDDFVRNWGHISGLANRLVMAEDPEYPLLQALESDYDKGVSADIAKKQGIERRAPSARKAAIFTRRVMVPRREITRVETTKDALVVSMNELGRVDMARMMRLCGKSQDDVIRDLRGLIYLNPERDRWETSNQYLTGNVKMKLGAARAAARNDARFLENVNALERVQPADIEPVDISIQLGATWVPDRVIDRFISHLFGDVRRQVSYQEAVGKWMVHVSAGDPTTMRVTWGIAEYPANQIFTAIMTHQPIQVRVHIGEDEQGRPRYEVDQDKTAAAIQKADEIRQAFLDWVWVDQEQREQLARLYNDRFNTNVPCRYDGSHLELPGAALGIRLRPSQKDGIWRGIQDGTVLYDHVVGAGKTFTMIGTIMESRRMGLLTKPMLVVPNHLLLQWKDAFYALYPGATILVAEKSDFQKEHRERLFSRIATGQWDAVIVAHSSFKKIGMPEDTLKDLLTQQLEDLTTAIEQLNIDRGNRATVKELEKTRERIAARLERKANAVTKDRAVTFPDLGVDALFVDEAHEFKNLYITTALNRVAGLGNLRGSDKAFDLFVKCRYLQERYGGRGVFFATGTPISNTIAELYTMQRYLQYSELKARRIAQFDSWASVFGRVVTGWELDATGVNYRLNSRFSRFQNVPELTSLYRTFADVVTQSDLNQQAAERGLRFPVPRVHNGRPQNIVVDRSPAQAAFMDDIIHRMENLPTDPRIDNPLKITNEARKAGLDFRLINASAADDPGSKINTAVRHIYRIWLAWRDQRGTQLVFCDLSTPKNLKVPTQELPPESTDDDDSEETPAVSMDDILSSHSAFSVYDDIKSKLVARGIPAREIRFIHEASTDLQKSKLFDEMNRGTVRILLGSTAKMGAGTNVQRRLVAEHHLDAPWRPSDLEQREGRILRQGNLFYENDPEGFAVELLRYATKQTYDSRMWQVIEGKAAAIEQFRKGDSLLRVIDDIAGEAANAAEMKAAATGNPLIFLQVQLDAELRKVEALYANFQRDRHQLERRIHWLDQTDQRADKEARNWQKEIALRDANTPATGGCFRINGRSYGPKEQDQLQDTIVLTLKAIAGNGPAPAGAAKADDRVLEPSMHNPNDRFQTIGEYRGFTIGVCSAAGAVQFCLLGSTLHVPPNLAYRSGDEFSGRGFITRLDNFLKCFERCRDDVEETRAREKLEYAKALAELNAPFSQLERLEALREDVRSVMRELKIVQGNSSYISTWRPRSVGAGRDIVTGMAAAESCSDDEIQEPRAVYVVAPRA